MGKITGNEPAQPIVREELTTTAFDRPVTMMEVLAEGLTIRQHYAGLAMQGLLANAELGNRGYNECAHDAVKQADWLIAELNKDK